MAEQATEPTIVHLDELKQYALRDPSKLTPGTRVIFGHVPRLENPGLEESKSRASGEEAMIVEVAMKSHNELYSHRAPTEFEGSDRKSLIIFHESKDYLGEKRISHRYASDSGVTPYTDQHSDPKNPYYNDTNFTVLVSDLEALGLVAELTVSADYAERLRKFNEQVVEWDYDYDDAGY